jgi:protein SCO1
MLSRGIEMTIILAASLLMAGLVAASPALAESQYACPMHPDIKSASSGAKCSKCSMAVIPSPTSAASENAEVSNLRIKFPEAQVYDQLGKKLNFYVDLIKERTVAINFVFTTCTTICPPLTATFRRVQQQLGDRIGRDVFLISVSVDPVTDVPERLRAYSEKFKAAPGWTFVTGSKTEIDSLLRALGAYVPDKNDHAPTILIGNDAARFWTRAYGLAPAATIVRLLNEASGKESSLNR